MKFLARVTLAVSLALATILLGGAPAHAVHVVAATSTVIAFTLPWPLVIATLVSIVLPLIVGLVTKTVTSAAIKAILLAALAAITAVLTELGLAIEAGRSYDLGVGLLIALGSFLVAVGIHFGLLKPTGAAAAAQRVGDPSHR